MRESEELRRLVRFCKKIGLSYFEIGKVTGYSSTSVSHWGKGTPPRDMEGMNDAVKRRITRHIKEIVKEARELDIDLGDR